MMLLETPPYPEWHREYNPSMTPPNRFWGLITKNGKEVPDGQVVYGVFSTKDDMENDLGLKVRGTCMTERKIFEDMPYNYDFNVPTEGTVYWEQGELIYFYVGAEKASETANLVIAAVTELDLHIEEIPTPPDTSWIYPALAGLFSVAVIGICIFTDHVYPQSRHL